MLLAAAGEVDIPYPNRRPPKSRGQRLSMWTIPVGDVQMMVPSGS
jgi:hypothetical protein